MNNDQIKLKIHKLYNHYNAGNYEYVIKECGILLRKMPTNFFLMNLVGSCFQRIGQLDKAKKIFEDIVALDKSNISALNNLGNTHKMLKEFDLAEAKYKKALVIDPNFWNCLQNYANLKFDLNQYYEAIALYKKAISIEPKNYMIYYNLGLVYQSLGKFEDAKFYLKKVTEINPKFTNADKIISRFTKYKKGDSHIVDMANRLQNLDLNDISKSNILFSLGKAYEDIKKYENSFELIEKANNLLKKFKKYDFKNDKDIFESIKNTFKNIKFKDTNEPQNNKRYIFIVGLPRSGTSLTEQILSSHSQVYGAGELPYFADAIKSEFFKQGKLSQKNNKIIEDTVIQEKIAGYYNKSVNNYRFKEDYLTDKNPLNFLWIGFIKLVFPNAKIIHVKRNIKDNYFSLYKNVFDGNMNWCYDKSDLLNYTLNYLELMKFWKNKFPDYIFDIEYENIISNTQSEVERLLAFCNLPWEDKCLEFYKTSRAIKTVSSAQARMPIYKSSIKSFENYENYLKDYFSKLEKV